MAADPERVDRKIKSLARTWNAFGARDPLWAVLTDPSKRGRRWLGLVAIREDESALPMPSNFYVATR